MNQPPVAKHTLRANRLYANPNRDINQELRSEFQRDLDRLLYTTYFRRLARVTQVSATVQHHGKSDPYGLIHNRLTHSLKVGQVARRLCQYLLRDAEVSGGKSNLEGIEKNGGIDPNVAEVAGRAHDIGHPPFGHLGEEILDEIAVSRGLEDGFEGNAQTFRVLATLVRRVPVVALEKPRHLPAANAAMGSLDLTAASLAACVKYPWPRGGNPNKPKKWGFFEPDRDVFLSQVQPLLNDGRPTLEAQIMDWADDITYATHDIEDFAANGRIPLPNLQHTYDARGNLVPINPEETDEFLSYVRVKLTKKESFEFDEAVREFREFATLFPSRIRYGHPADMAVLGALTSQLITSTSKATSVRPDGNLEIKRASIGLVEILKQLTWFYVIDSPEMASVQRGQRRRFKRVATDLVNWALDVFRTEVEGPDGSRRKLSLDEIKARRVVLPELLRSLVSAAVDANEYHGIYPGRPDLAVVRGTIDYIASLTEDEVENLHDELF